MHFHSRPAEIIGTDHVEALRCERPDGSTYDIPAQLVFRSVGYIGTPMPGVPFDEITATVPNSEGRVLGPDGAPLPGEYVAGWLKRGPTGVIGTNKSDAAASVRSLLSDFRSRSGVTSRRSSPRHKW